MRPQTRSNYRLSRSLFAASCAAIAGCHSANNIPVPKSGAQLEGQPTVVTVTRNDGGFVTVYAPAIARDSLIGWLDEPSSNRAPRSRVAISVADIRQISASKGGHGATRDVAAATGILLLTGVFLIGAALLAWGISGID